MTITRMPKTTNHGLRHRLRHSRLRVLERARMPGYRATVSGSSAVPVGTYYLTVEGTSDGYTDETIIAVTVTVPSVAVTSPGNMTAMQTSTSTMVSSTTVSSFADVVGRHGSTCRFCGTCSIDCLRLPGRKLLIRGLAELSMPGIFDTVGSQDHKDSQCQPIANYFSLLSKRCLILITTPNAT